MRQPPQPAADCGYGKFHLRSSEASRGAAAAYTLSGALVAPQLQHNDHLLGSTDRRSQSLCRSHTTWSCINSPWHAVTHPSSSSSSSSSKLSIFHIIQVCKTYARSNTHVLRRYYAPLCSGGYATMTVVYLCVCLCVSVPDPKSRTEGHSKLKDWQEGSQWHADTWRTPFGGRKVEGQGHQTD